MVLTLFYTTGETLMKLTVDFTKLGPNVTVDQEMADLTYDEYYAMMADAIQTLQTHLLGQYSIDEHSDNNG